MPLPDEWIWVTGWEDFQTFQKKRDKPWSPPWIKTYVAQLDDHRYLDLTDRQRSLLHDLRMMFATSRGRTRCEPRTITRHRHQRTRYSDLEALNHAGLIEFCSGTVLEQKRAAFWNSSNLEVEEKRNPPSPPVRGGSNSGSRRRARGGTVPEPFSISKRWASYIDNVAYLHNADPLHNQLTLQDALEELAYWRTQPLAENDITDEDARAQWDEAHQTLADLPL